MKDNYWYRYVFSLPRPGKWEICRLPLSARFTEGKVPRKGGMSNLDTLMISIWHRNEKPVVVLLDDLKIVRSDNPSLYKTVR